MYSWRIETQAMAEKLTLAPNDIHLWVTEPHKIRDSLLLSHYQQLLTPEETRKQQRYRFEKDQHDALITRAFVRTVLSQYADIAPADWRFEKGEKDKPEIVNPPLPLRFNISHTTELIACAVTLHDDIGCDVEYIGRDNDILSIADRYFSDLEVKELFSLPEEKQASRFFDYWTLKESYIKAWGLGLAIPLGDFSFHIADGDTVINNNIRLSFAPHRVDTPEKWQSWLIYPNDTHRMAISLCSDKPQTRQLRFFRSTPLIGYNEVNFPKEKLL